MPTYVFPGQGSQYRGMGEDLFEQFSELTQKANQILGYSIKELCLEDPFQQLNQTQFTQPALFVVNALTYLKKYQQINRTPHHVAGHSLGEYNALLAAGVFDFETGLKIVKKRGELMSQTIGGGMAAIVGLSIENINSILHQNNLHDIFIANYNSHTQIVISGLKANIDRTLHLFEKAGAMMIVPLKVSGAFHSPLMKAVKEEFAIYIQQFTFAEPTIPVIANITARPYSTSELYQNLSQQITHPVRWTECIEYILSQGENEFEEIGPGMVLSGLIRRIKNGQ